MIENFEIIPGRGVGNILLGMNKKDVEKILGKPDDIEKMTHDDGGTSSIYYYDDFGLNLSFESEDDFRLSYISFDGEEFHLKNKIKIGESSENLIKICKELSFSEPEVEDMSKEGFPNQISVSFEKENIIFWFTDNVLDEIEIGPFWLDDDSPVWPV
jgi:hypothetical protein